MLGWALLSIPVGAIAILGWCLFLNNVLFPAGRNKAGSQLPAE